MSDTPETDAASHGFVQLNPQKTDVDIWNIECVDAEFARSLERRLAEAHSDLQIEKSDHAETSAMCRKEVEELKAKLKQCEADARRLEKYANHPAIGEYPRILEELECAQKSLEFAVYLADAVKHFQAAYANENYNSDEWRALNRAVYEFTKRHDAVLGKLAEREAAMRDIYAPSPVTTDRIPEETKKP